MPRSTALVRALARSAAAAACLVGLFVWLGWALDVMVLKSMGAAMPVMRPGEALGLMLGGAALGLRLRRDVSRTRHRLGTVLAWATAVLGAASLVDLVLTMGSGGLDALFLRLLDDEGLTQPGLTTSPLTSLCLLLLGPALALLDRGGEARLSWPDGLVSLTLMAALLGLNSFLLGPLGTSTAAPFFFFQERSMGLHTTCVLVLLAVGTLCARPDQGLMARLTRDTLGGFVARRLVPVTLLGPPVLGLTLVLMHLSGTLSHDAKFPLFATVVAAGGATLVLLAARALDLLDSERRKANSALEASEVRFRTFLDTAPDPMVVVDASGRLRFANAEAERVFGYRREALLGREVELLVPEGLHGPSPSGPPRATGGRLVTGRRQDGTSVPLEVRLSPLEGAADATLIAILRDVTERRELEKLREEYVGLISHDLRNPLSTINLRAHLLQRALHERKLEREGHMAQAIIHNVEWMNTMIEELLEGSRLESGRVDLRRESRDLGRFLEEVLERDLPPDARERFRLHLEAPLPPVPLDAARLERVVTNLLTNAIKYSPQGTPVDVRLTTVHEQAVVSVSNQGVGLSTQDAAHLFDKYYRTEDGRSADGKGLGLGLYISRLIVEAHGGHIWVESEPDRGVTFFFSVPLEAVAAAPGAVSPRQRAG